LHSATSSTATKLEALEGLPPDEEPVLDLLKGVLSLVVPGEEPLFFSLLLMVSFVQSIVLFRGSMSYILVDKNAQNVWTTNIRDIVHTNRTGHIYLQLLLRVSVQ
jgi:hypothetical protein